MFEAPSVVPLAILSKFVTWRKAVLCYCVGVDGLIGVVSSFGFELFCRLI